MKRQNFDASSYTDYIKKRTNTALVQSRNFKDKKSIVSTPPSILDTLSVSLRTEFEPPPVIEPVVPEPPPPPPETIVTIVNGMPVNGNSEMLGDYFSFYVGESDAAVVSWVCFPPSEVTVREYAIPLDSTGVVYFPIGPPSNAKTVTTTGTSYTVIGRDYHTEYSLDFFRVYVTITPTDGPTVETNMTVFREIGF